MDRRQFFKSLAIGVPVAVIAPQLLIPEEKSKFITYTNPDGIKISLLHDPKLDDPIGFKSEGRFYWISKQEWDAEEQFMQRQEQLWWETV
jgi:hypothetical protein